MFNCVDPSFLFSLFFLVSRIRLCWRMTTLHWTVLQFVVNGIVFGLHLVLVNINGYHVHQKSKNTHEYNLTQWFSISIFSNISFQRLLENKLVAYKEQLNKRKQLLKQSVEDYEDLISRTGLLSSIDVCHFFSFSDLLDSNSFYLGICIR